jgi:mono/diheme cytochrome c family protein
VAQGGSLYGRFCGVCHGDAAVSGALNPDLRYSAALENPDAWRTIVIDGALRENGMVLVAPGHESAAGRHDPPICDSPGARGPHIWRPSGDALRA